MSLDVYKHYKGGIYNVIGVSKHTETEELLVVYEDTRGGLWSRPHRDFIGEVEVDGKLVPIFELIGSFTKTLS